MTRNCAFTPSVPRFLMVAPSGPERISVWLSVTTAVASSVVTVRSTLPWGAEGGGRAGAGERAVFSAAVAARGSDRNVGSMTSAALSRQQRLSRRLNNAEYLTERRRGCRLLA